MNEGSAKTPNRKLKGRGSLAGREMGSESPAPTAPDPTVRARPVRAWPLGWHLYLFALALIAPLLGFGVFAASRLGDAERVIGEDQARRTASMVTATIDRELSRLFEVLEALAKSGPLLGGDLAGFHRDAGAVIAGTGHAVLLVDPQLNQLVNTRVPYGTPLPQFGDPDNARKVFATGTRAMSDLVISQVLREPRIALMVPVVIDGGVRYAAALSIEPVVLNRLLAQQYLPDGWIARVSNRNGLILAQTARFEELVGKPVLTDHEGEATGRSDVFVTKDRDGVPVLLAHHRSDVSGWRIATWVPLSILEAPARQLWQALAALAALAMILSLIAAALLGRRLARPIAGAASAAAALGRGDPVGYTPSAIAEVNVVGKALAAAARARIAAETALHAREALLRAATDNAAVGLVMLDCERRYTFANPAYAKILGLPHSAAELIGKRPADVLASVYETQISPRLDRAFAGERVTYELARPRAGAAAAETGHYVVAYDPLCNQEGTIDGVIATLFDITERKAAEADLAQLAAIVESSDDAIIGKTLDGRITSWNAGAERIFGYTASEMIGQPILRIIPPELHGEEEQILSRLKRGERIDHYETSRVTKDARRIDLSLTVSPVRDKAGNVIGASKVGRDITERKRADEHLRSLMRELSHRTKNVMAIVHAISFQTARQSPDIKDFEQRFTQRLAALSRSHDLLVKRDWHGVVLEDLVRGQLDPFLDSAKERLAAHGPALLLRPQAAQDLGMVLHELATNASKYGALSVPTGKIEIGWTIDDGAADGKRFRMTWRESGGPMVSPPARPGFGSTVITRSLSGTLKGKTELEYRAEGVSWQLTAPLGGLIAELHDGRTATPLPGGADVR